MTRWIAAALVGALTIGSGAPAQPAEKAIRIGVLTDMSGPYADIAGKGVEVAARFAIEDAKAAAKGWKVEVVSADHQNKPDIAANIARKWFDVDGFDAVLDLTNSAAAIAVGQVAREKNKVALGTGPQASDLTDKLYSPNFVHWVSDTWALSHGTAKAVVQRGGDSWFFLTADYAFGHAHGASFV